MSPSERLRVRPQSYFLAYILIAVFEVLAHGPILRLPFFWDEAGQFIPAALDIFRSNAWIPVSTIPNVHPPGLMAYLSLFWGLTGFSIVATRIAMLLVAAGGALACFLLSIELSRHSPGTPAFSALSLLCISPLFFAQSMLAQLDMPAMGLTVLALLFFLQDHHRSSAGACLALVLVKETGIVAPVVFAAWLLYERKDSRDALWYLVPFGGLLAWLTFLHAGTGSWFGNNAFAAYNIGYELRPDRFLFALIRRLYYLFFSSGHFIGTAVLIYVWKRMPLFRDRAWRVAASLVALHILMVSALGGAVLERYLLPVLPIVYIAFALALRGLVPKQRIVALTGLIACLIAANFINPLYSFPFENNLAFVSFVQLQQSATAEAEFASGPVAAAFPLSNGLRNPDLGYVINPPKVIEMTDYSAPEIEKLKGRDPWAVVVYNPTWDPIGLLHHPAISQFLTDHYGYQPQLSTSDIASRLHMHIAARWHRRGFTMEVLKRGEHLRL